MSDDRYDSSSAVATVTLAAILLLAVFALLGGLGFYFFSRVQVQQQRALAAAEMARAQMQRAIASERALSQAVPAASPLMVELDAAGNVNVNGQVVDVDQLKSLINAQSGGISIRSDATCPASIVAEVMRHCLESGARDIHIEVK